MRINNNLMAINTHRAMGMVQGAQSKSMEKLSSGYRINRAGDDAAGLAISEKMRGQIRGLSQASRNSQDAISLIQTSEGALNETHAILQRMRELAVQSASDTNTGDDRGKIQSEIDQLTSEINRIGNTTEFNTMKLLDGSRSETSRELTSTVRTVATSGVLTANYAQGITKLNSISDTDIIQSGKITIANDGELEKIAEGGAATGTGTVRIELGTAANTFKITTKFLSSAAGTRFTSIDTVEFTEGTDFTYDAHGISFTIEAENFSKFTAAGTGIEIAIEDQDTDIDGGTTLTTSNDWDKNASAGATGIIKITNGLTVDVSANSDLEDARKVVLKFTSNTYTVTVTDSASQTIINDTVTLSAGGTFTAGTTYDNQGIKFSFSNGFTGSTTASIAFTLETKETKASSTVEDNSLSFQIGANEDQSMSLSLEDMRSEALGLSSITAGVDGEAGYRASMTVNNGTDNTATEFGLDVSSFEAAGSAITKIDEALEKVSEQRSKLGAVQNRLEHTIANLDTSAENLQASESRVRDVDMAKEMMEFTKNNILQQAAQSMLAQANQAPQGVLQLLR